MSTPFPPVISIREVAKTLDWLENIWSEGIPKVLITDFRFSSVPTVAKLSRVSSTIVL